MMVTSNTVSLNDIFYRRITCRFTGVLEASCSEDSKKSPVNYQRLSPLITYVTNIWSANFTKGGLHY